MKKEKPKINFVLKLLRLQYCSKPRPAEAVHKHVLRFNRDLDDQGQQRGILVMYDMFK